MNVKQVNQTKFGKATSSFYVVAVHRATDQEQWVKDLKEKTGVDLVALLKQQLISHEEGKVSLVPTMQETGITRIVTVGLGAKSDWTMSTVRESFAAVGKVVLQAKAEEVTICVPALEAFEQEIEEVVNVAVEGIGLGQYVVPHYKATVNEVAYEWSTLGLDGAADLDVTVGLASAEAVNYARTLVNMPPNILTAREMARQAEKIAEKHGFEIEVLGKEELEEIGAGALLAVNQGSVEPPRLIVMKYHGGGEDWTDVLGLVGKGITFDTGGYTLKPGASMVGMKGDMGGAAAVLGAMDLIGTLRPERNVMAVIASTDNMINGEAIRPDDVITSLSGKTIEIVSTDAEGRLVLADAVTYAKQEGADYLVDVATLTGGVIVALGKDKTGAVTNDEAYFEEFMQAAIEADEFVWRLPLTKNDKKRIRKSLVADLNNAPGRDGHMIFGGGFVGEFVEDTLWVHLDIAGTSDAEGPHVLGPKGATGVMVRTLATFAEQFEPEK